jgi:hypothetical protein
MGSLGTESAPPARESAGVNKTIPGGKISSGRRRYVPPPGQEPTSARTFGDEYEAYRRAVPAWRPRLHSWSPDHTAAAPIEIPWRPRRRSGAAVRRVVLLAWQRRRRPAGDARRRQDPCG